MLKKIVSIFTVFIMVITLSGCSDDTKENTNDTKDTSGEEKDTGSSADKPFSESEGMIRYLIIDDVQIAIPETVGEYAKYLAQIGTKVELITNPSEPDEVTALDDTLEANNQSSLKAYFKVYLADEEWQKFGVHYVNNSEDDIDVSEAKIDKISLYNDHLQDGEEELKELMAIDEITLVTPEVDIIMDNDTKSSYIMKMLGAPAQNTDGYLTYRDPSGFVYVLNTFNKKGILRQVDITYPK
jgi:hypothetical protein